MGDKARNGPRQDGNGRINLQGLQQVGEAFRLGVKQLKLGQRQNLIVEFLGRVLFGVPFDKGRCSAVKRKRTIRRDSDKPIERAATHRFDVSKWFRGSRHLRLNVSGANHPRGEHSRGLWNEGVEGEPAGMAGFDSRWIRGDNLKKHGLAKPQEQIVSSHTGMLPSGLRRNTQRIADKLCTRCERRCGNGDVIDDAARQRYAPKV